MFVLLLQMIESCTNFRAAFDFSAVHERTYVQHACRQRCAAENSCARNAQTLFCFGWKKYIYTEVCCVSLDEHLRGALQALQLPLSLRRAERAPVGTLSFLFFRLSPYPPPLLLAPAVNHAREQHFMFDQMYITTAIWTTSLLQLP